jgi:hypothetical protein
MFEIEESVLIDRPIETVWAFVMDVAREPLWQTTLTAARLETPGPIEAGSVVCEVRRFLGRQIETTWRCVACEAPTLSSIESVSSPFAWNGTYHLSPEGAGTRFTLVMHADPGAFFRVAEALFARMAHREVAGTLANLKDVLEAGIADAVTAREETATRS